MPTNPTDVVSPGFTVNAITPIVLTIDPSRGENGAPGAPGQGINWRGNWQTGISYAAYDSVASSGGSYLALVQNVSINPATDTGAVWGTLSVPGAQGPPGPPGGTWRGNWVATTAYKINDLVGRSGQSYIAIAASTNQDPVLDTGHVYWNLVAASGSGGDMYKSTYDINNHGYVDKAALANAVPWTGITGTPAVFPPDATAMLKSVYDTNNDAIVDHAALADTAPWTGVTGKQLATTSAAGLLQTISGLPSDYVGGDNACHPIAPQIWSVRMRSFNATGNPSLECDQINIGNAVATANAKIIDRWFLSKVGTMAVSSGRQSVATGINLPGTSFAITRSFFRVTLTTAEASLAASDFLYISQLCEGPQFRELQNDVHSLQVLVRSSVANLIIGSVLLDPASTHSLTNTLTLGAANTWVLLPLPNLPLWTAAGNFVNTPGNLGYQLILSLACGSTYTSPANGTWQNAQFLGALGQSNFAASPVNSTFDIAFVQHEPGPVCSGLIDCPFTQNLNECKRYFAKSYDYGTLPGTVTNNGQINMITIAGGGLSATRFPRSLAKLPVYSSNLKIYSPQTGALNNVYDNSGTAADKAVSNVAYIGLDGFGVINFTAGGVGSYAMAHYIADTGW